MKDLEEDFTNTLKSIVQETQEIALEELSSCNQLLLSSQVIVQRDADAIRKATNNLQIISQKLDDIFSFNLIPKINFMNNKNLMACEELEEGIDMLSNELFDSSDTILGEGHEIKSDSDT